MYSRQGTGKLLIKNGLGSCCLHRSMCHGLEWRIVWDVYSNTVECRGRPGFWGQQEEGWPKEGRGCFFPSFSPSTWLEIPTGDRPGMAGNSDTAVLSGLQKEEEGKEESPATALFTLLGASCSTGGLSMVALDPGAGTALLGATGMCHDTVGAQVTLWDLGPWPGWKNPNPSAQVHPCTHPAVPSSSQASAGAEVNLQLILRCQPSHSSLGNQGSSCGALRTMVAMPP